MDINKLPKWARIEIEKLRGDLKYYKDRVLEIKGDKETNVYIANVLGEPIPLPKDSRIIFVINPKKDISCGQVQVRTNGDEIEIYGSERLSIHPNASNTCSIKSRRE